MHAGFMNLYYMYQNSSSEPTLVLLKICTMFSCDNCTDDYHDYISPPPQLMVRAPALDTTDG